MKFNVITILGACGLAMAISQTSHAAVTSDSPGARPLDVSQPRTLALTSIKMVDRFTGWAESDAGILRTTDDGKTWKTVLGVPDDQFCEGGFQDAKTACVAVFQDEKPGTSLFCTEDGGEHWTKNYMLSPWPDDTTCAGFSFVDRSCWLMLKPERSMNSCPGDLYRSDDAGKSWRHAGRAASVPEHFIGSAIYKGLPYGGEVSFVDNSNGWLVGNETTTTPNVLSATHDGGRTWKRLHLQPPPQLARGYVNPQRALPVFFAPDNKQGVLFTTFYPKGDDAQEFTVIYATHDCGRSWKPMTPIELSSARSFISVSEGWAWSRIPHDPASALPAHGTLYHTVDGGEKWFPVNDVPGIESSLARGEDIIQLDFVDSSSGWAIVGREAVMAEACHWDPRITPPPASCEQMMVENRGRSSR